MRSRSEGIGVMHIPRALDPAGSRAAPPSIPAIVIVGTALALSAIAGPLMGGGLGDRARILTFATVILLATPRWLLLAASIVLLRTDPLQLENIGYAIPLTLADLLLLAWLARQTFAAAARGVIQLPRQAWWLMAFLVWAWAATLLAGVTVTPLMRLTTYALVAIAIMWDPPERTRLLWVVTLYAGLELLVSMPDLSSPTAGRTVGDPHEFGLLLLTGAIPFIAGALLRRHLLLRWCLSVGLLGGALATTRRAIWFAAAVILAMAFVKRVSPRRLLAVGATLGIIGILLFNPISDAFELGRRSADVRVRSIVLGVNSIEQDPILGTGWAGLHTDGVSATGDRVAPPFNLFVNVGASLGIPGLVLLIGYVGSVVRATARDEDRTGFLFMGAFLALSLTATTLYAESLVTLLFFILAGLYSDRRHGSPYGNRQ